MLTRNKYWKKAFKILGATFSEQHVETGPEKQLMVNVKISFNTFSTFMTVGSWVEKCAWTGLKVEFTKSVWALCAFDLPHVAG